MPRVPIRESLFNRVVEAAPNAMVLVSERGLITLVNVQTEKLFGYSRSELLGRPIEVLVPERFRSTHPQLRDAFGMAPSARPMGQGRDLYGLRKDGSEIPVEIAINPLKTDEGALVLAAIVDITERKRAEELRLLHAGVQQHATELEALNRELESASRFKTQFVATMSHELRTPLTAIVGAAELLSRTELDERSRISVETITEAGEALLALINSILDFSKIEAGKMDLRSTEFDVEGVLEGAAELTAQAARDKGIALHTYVDPLIPPVRGDPDRLRQVLVNLLSNAIKFTDRGHVVARAVPSDATGREALLRFEVQDTGIGIAPQARRRIFEPFSQAAGAVHKSAGTGLGLSISKRLVELMGGQISVQSEPGAGSLFSFTVRFERAPGVAAAQTRTLQGVGGVILSEDETFANIIERYMESWSMETRRARSHADVIEALRSRGEPAWIAIVDTDGLNAGDIGATLELLGSIVPARVIAIGKDGPLRKPIRQSYLFDAIVRAAELGVGTTKAAARPQAARAPAAAVPVLVAEDNLRLRRLLQLQFDDLGVPVAFASDGVEALEALRTGNYAMVFMDCQMPNLDGFGTTKAIRERERDAGSHLPIVAMTANAFAEDRENCLAAGMDDYLAKPVKLAALRAMIERWAKPNATEAGQQGADLRGANRPG